MQVFRYNTQGPWFKGNTHIHSTASDGGKTFNEIASLYANAGYHFLFRTDHWVASRVQSDPAQYPLLWLDGIELHGCDRGGSYYHVVCLGSFTGLTENMGLVAALESARAQGGLLILAHPHWMGNSFEDALRYGFHGVEIYNHVCQWLNGKGDAAPFLSALLCRRGETLAFASDDAHLRPEHPGWNGGWITVNAVACSAEALLASIRAGNFYSSCGPEIHSLEYSAGSVRISCSPVSFVRLAGPAHRGKRVGTFGGAPVTSAVFEVPPDWQYAYIELEDEQRRRAWTNTLFVPEKTAANGEA